ISSDEIFEEPIYKGHIEDMGSDRWHAGIEGSQGLNYNSGQRKRTTGFGFGHWMTKNWKWTTE
ncbi:hypothetical protein FRB97_003218, partial [Tulasnella sp. 331]